MKKFVVIVAGGSGSRMKSKTPKQFLLLDDKPILIRSLEAFHNYDPNIAIVVVLPIEQTNKWQELIRQYDFKIDHQIVAGGTSRFQSVQNGLDAILAPGLVAIHDGVRPLVSNQVIKDTFDKAEKFGSGVAAVDVKDSLRVIDGGENRAVDRSLFKAMQTPQTFRVQLIKTAFEFAAESRNFTDDASVLENYGEIVYLTDGDYKNIKITTPEDLKLAEIILKQG